MAEDGVVGVEEVEVTKACRIAKIVHFKQSLLPAVLLMPQRVDVEFLEIVCLDLGCEYVLYYGDVLANLSDHSGLHRSQYPQNRFGK